MPIPLPDLDDRTFADLVAEARALIPAYAPDWTDRNPTDPGITVIEVLAYVTEGLLYRLNRVTDANRLSFLRLLNGPTWVPTAGRSLADEVRVTVTKLREPNRAVTARDYERLALAAAPAVARAFCLPNRDLESEPRGGRPVPRPGHMSVVVVPAASGPSSGPGPVPDDLLGAVAADLDARRLLTTQVHVVGPRLVAVGVRATLVLRPDAPRAISPTGSETLAEAVRRLAVDALRAHFDPLTGGPDKTGWPFGRGVFVSEVYETLERIPGLDYVTRTAGRDGGDLLDELTVPDADQGRLQRSRDGDLIGVALHAYELVDLLSGLHARPEDLTVVPPRSV